LKGGLWALIDIHKKTSRFLLRSMVQLVANSDQIIESIVDEIDKFLALFNSTKKPQE
jgi:hypothetical protein